MGYGAYSNYTVYETKEGKRMRLVIDIPEDTYKRTKFYKEFRDLNDCVLVLKAIEHAIELPKGHGRLIDADDIALIDEQFYITSDYYVAESAINDTPTIIEAYKAERSDKE